MFRNIYFHSFLLFFLQKGRKKKNFLIFSHLFDVFEAYRLHAIELAFLLIPFAFFFSFAFSKREKVNFVTLWIFSSGRISKVYAWDIIMHNIHRTGCLPACLHTSHLFHHDQLKLSHKCCAYLRMNNSKKRRVIPFRGVWGDPAWKTWSYSKYSMDISIWSN